MYLKRPILELSNKIKRIAKVRINKHPTCFGQIKTLQLVQLDEPQKCSQFATFQLFSEIKLYRYKGIDHTISGKKFLSMKKKTRVALFTWSS
jgi:hypothetical protein